MPIDLRCPTCDSRFEVKSSSIDSYFDCPDCDERFRAEDPHGDERRPEPQRRTLTRLRRHARERRSGSGQKLWMILVPVLLILGTGAFFLIRWAIKDDPNKLPAGWERVEEPGKFRVNMPGKPTREVKRNEWGPYTLHKYYKKDTFIYTAGNTESQIPFEFLQQPPEAVLDMIATRYVQSLGAVERSRQFIQLSGNPGIELIFDAPQIGATGVLRYYLAQGFVFDAVAVGKGFTVEHQDVKRFFDSFEILQGPTGSKPQPPVQKQPPKQEPPIQQPPRQDPPIRQPPIEPNPPIDPKGEPKPDPRYEQSDPAVLGAKPADGRLNIGVPTVYLSDMSEFGGLPCAVGWSFAKNGKLGSSYEPGKAVVVNGVTPAHSLSMHPPVQDYTRIAYSLGKKAKSFEGAVAISKHPGSNGAEPVKFVVLGDGKVLWRSGSIKDLGIARNFNIEVSQVSILELRAYCEGGSNHGSAAVWVDPLVRAK